MKTVDDLWDEASLATNELIGPNAYPPDWDATHERIFEELCEKEGVGT